MAGRFVGRGQWIVHAVVAYDPAAPATERDASRSEAQMDLMVGIARESQRGVDAGARTVHVVIEGDCELAGLFRFTGEAGQIRPAV